VVRHEDGSCTTSQAGAEHVHAEKFTGRGINPLLRPRLDEEIQNGKTAPKALLEVLRNAKLIQGDVKEPNLQQVSHNTFVSLCGICVDDACFDTYIDQKHTTSSKEGKHY